LQMLAYEPMVLLTAVGFYMCVGSFDISEIMLGSKFPLPYLAGMFIGFVFILTIKFRKSPFDLSMSHHAHQELVAGLKTEFSGKTLALIEAAHWYENIFLLGFVFLFFANGTIWGAVVGVVVCLVTYFFEIFIDNSFARMKWQVAINSAWIVALVLGTANLFILLFI
ncbi:MAG: NADH-quinone oxidoreductase subunit H, partial [Anaerovoracaceae bacterium]